MIHYAGVPSIVVTSSKSQRRDEKEDQKKEKPKERRDTATIHKKLRMDVAGAAHMQVAYHKILIFI